MDSLWLIGYLLLAGAAIVQALLVAINVYEHRRRALVRLKKISYYAPTRPGACALALQRTRRPPAREPAGAVDAGLSGLRSHVHCRRCRRPRLPGDPPGDGRLPADAGRLFVAGQAEGCGQKVHNLRAATAEVPPEIRHLAFFDSDSRPKPYCVRAAIYKHYLPRIGATTGYRWLIPQKPTITNHLVCAINCNVMAVLGRDSHHLVWGGAWAIRRETFQRLKIHAAWEGMLSDDLVASNQLHAAGLEVRFDPACVLTSPVDFDAAGMFDFVRRQYRITRHYAFRWWMLALAAATVGNLAWLVSLGLLAGTLLAARSSAWLPATVLGCFTAWAFTVAGPCRDWLPSTRRRVSPNSAACGDGTFGRVPPWPSCNGSG